ncbi:hypothetical protein SAMN05421810_102290 [Amycolatopsis arida]|uniref:Integral membrane protein n=1 Tax=Amycolatopsis arida TaxID=587909 RepID=A0A1I5PH26_9PSEU|nr:hypothetical protein [Amycolatopsis arida]TDX98498.1 hypothetical protein CLV69_101290 [Amycolatopsis arida]SFP33335.1 hypothetical protein SAMN05421810_102290 [Amycolatopsis arida]
MPLVDRISPAPREVRVAGALTALPGLAALALAVLLLVTALRGQSTVGGDIYAEVAYYALLAAGVLACAGGLLLGRTWARSPAVVLALVVVGVGWYATGPSARPEFGVPLMAAGVLVVVLLFRRPSRAWALGMREGESEEEAARRGGYAGRVEARERDERRDAG